MNHRPSGANDAGVIPSPPPMVAIDANALDRDGSTRDGLVEAFQVAAAAGRLRLYIPRGVAAEMMHPAAPKTLHDLVADAPAPPRNVPLTPRQHIDRIRVRAILRGDGRAGKHDADAAHVSDAAEAGCAFFVTRDGKILRKRDILRDALPQGFRILTIEDFMAGRLQ